MKILQLGLESKAVHQSEHQHHQFRVGLKAEQGSKTVQIIESLVDYREPDQRVDQKRIDVDSRKHSSQQRHAMADSEARHIDRDVLQPVQKENHAEQEQQVIVTRHHVFRAQVEKREN